MANKLDGTNNFYNHSKSCWSPLFQLSWLHGEFHVPLILNLADYITVIITWYFYVYIGIGSHDHETGWDSIVETQKSPWFVCRLSLHPWESQWCSSCLRASGFKAQEELLFPFKGRKKLTLQFEGHQVGRILLFRDGWAFLFILDIQIKKVYNG
jgi:hypothetical protein